MLRRCLALLLAVGTVLCLQPVYFFAMTNLDRVVSHERTWEHIRDAFTLGVLSPGGRSNNQIINGGDRITDCVSLGLGLQPGIDRTAAGIQASWPESDHACDGLKAAATNPSAVSWLKYPRYWHGYRLYSAPLASAFPILALKLLNLAVLGAVTIFFFIASSRLIGLAAALGLLAPVIFLTDYVRIWHVTPHTVSTAVIIGGAALFARAVLHKFSAASLILLAAVFGSLFNFVDFLVNPPWMPLLLAFFVLASPSSETHNKTATALLCVVAWFGAYSLTWISKWGVAYLVDPNFDIRADVVSAVAFRLAGDNERVVHFPLVATFKMIRTTILSWGLPLFVVFGIATIRVLRTSGMDRKRFYSLSWPAIIPIVWFEILSNHTQIHTFVARSAAAAIGVIVAAALIAGRVDSPELISQFKHIRRPKRRSAG